VSIRDVPKESKMAYNCFVKLDSVGSFGDGSVEFEVLTFHVGIAHRGGEFGIVESRTQLQELKVTKHVDAASTKLFAACAEGMVLKHLYLELLPAVQLQDSRQAFLTYKFTDVIVTSVEYAGSEQGDIAPVEQVSFQFAKIEVSFQGSTAGAGNLR
jgi:type VI secretion system secreted protein Hcp